MIYLNEIPESDDRKSIVPLIQTFLSSGSVAAEIETADVKVKPQSILSGIYSAAKKYNYPVKGRTKTIDRKRHYYIFRTDMEVSE